MQTQDDECLDHFEPAPPTREEIEFADTVGHVICLFNQAARGEHTAWALSGAMHSVMLRCGRCNGPRPSRRQRERLLGAITFAYTTAARTLPPLCRPSIIHAGMEALASLVVYWAAEDEQRTTWPQDTYLDACARARILRNVLHNISLTEEIEERIEKRRSKTVAALKQLALAKCEAP